MVQTDRNKNRWKVHFYSHYILPIINARCNIFIFPKLFTLPLNNMPPYVPDKMNSVDSLQIAQQTPAHRGD